VAVRLQARVPGVGEGEEPMSLMEIHDLHVVQSADSEVYDGEAQLILSSIRIALYPLDPAKEVLHRCIQVSFTGTGGRGLSTLGIQNLGYTRQALKTTSSIDSFMYVIYVCTQP
jgi:hypothetical protein